MAASAGSLVVKLGLDAAEYVQGLTRAEYQARKFGESIGAGIRSSALIGAAAITSVGAAALAANVAFNKLLDGAAKFQDLAEETGASAEGIAGLAVAAATAGVSIESVAGSTNKLTKSLVGVDDESKAAGAALSALGINVADFKKLDPVAQYEAVSVALAGFADGAGKTAVAMALFGKTGAEQLKVMKALEEQGGRTNILTAEQIALADEYRDRQARLTAELSLYASAIATQFIAPTNALISVVNHAVRAFVGMGDGVNAIGVNQGVQTFAENAGRALAGMIDYVKQSAAELRAITDFVTSSATAIGQAASFDFAGVRKTGEEFRARYGLDEVGRKIQADSGKQAAQTFVQAYNAALANAKRSTFAATDPRRVDLGSDGKASDARPAINFSGAVKPIKAGGGARSAAAVKDPYAEAQRYIESLQKQLEKTQDLTVQEQVLQDIQMGRLGQVSSAQKDQLLGIAGQIDAAKATEEVLKKQAEATELAARAQKSLMDEGARLYEQTRTPLEAFNAAQDRLNVLLESGAIDFVTAARAGEQYKKALDTAQSSVSELDLFAQKAAENIQSSIGSGLADAMDGNFKNIGKSFTQMLNRIVAEALAADIARKLFGGAVKGGEGDGFLGGLLKAAGGYFGFGGAKAAGGSVMPNTMYRVNENGPELLDYQGRQYLMNGNRSGMITPNQSISGGGGFTQQNTFVVEGRIDRRTQTQLADETRRKTQAAAVRFA